MNKFNFLVRNRRAFSTLALTKDRYPEAKRGSFSVLQDKDVQYFESLLEKSQVITEADEVESYNNDWLHTVRGYSSLVLKPKTTEEVSALLKYCNENNLAVCPQGGNTGLVGGSVPVFDEVIISMSNMNRIYDFDDLSGVLTCQSGCILENLMIHLKEREFIMPLDLGAKGSCQIGGNISTNAGGLRLLRYGSLHGSVLGLEAVLANGEILQSMNTLKKDNTGYHLKHLFIGAEGTLGLVTKVAIQCAPYPKATNLALIGLQNYDSVLSAYQLARSRLAEILSSCEMMDQISIEVCRRNLGISCPLTDMPFYMLLETSGSNGEHDEQKLNDFVETGMENGLILDGLVTGEPSKMQALWNLRDNLAPALVKDGYFYTYDITLPLINFYDLVGILAERLSNVDVITVSGFGHLGDSNIHVNVTSAEFDEKVLSLIEPFIYEWTAKYRGSVSAEHGIGFKKKKFLKYSKTENEIRLMRQFKQLMDPNGILNPYKVFD